MSNPTICSTCDGRGKRIVVQPGALPDRRGNVATRTLVCGHCDGTGIEPFMSSERSRREEVLAPIREAHDWQCDCTPDDPCRVLIALNGGSSRPFEPCGRAPVGDLTNCEAMNCEARGCAVAAAETASPVSLDDLT